MANLWKSKRRKKRALVTDATLLITPMADIFTILLVFLIKSFSTETSNIGLNAEITLPISSNAAPSVESTRLEISPMSVMLDDKPILSLHQFRFDPADSDGTKSSETLFNTFKKYRSRDSLNTGLRMLVLADEKTPYSTLKRVLTAATEAGFADYKLVVMEDK